MQRHFLFFFLFIFLFHGYSFSQSEKGLRLLDAEDVGYGASRLEMYLPLIKNKNVAVVTNQTGVFNGQHIIDTLLSLGITINKVFTPEHGFRGIADAGAFINNEIDLKTNIPLVSLYGKNKKPSDDQLQGIDVILFDLQDVGTRFYTYISTLTYVMEAAAQNNIPVIVLDSPNPNGFYIDGPILEKENSSFIGLHQVPVVYGLTIGEYALMVNGEKWLNNNLTCDLTVIPLSNYDRKSIYRLSIKPSPNLPNWEAVYLYPSLCFFEGTIVSVGRGTDTPFQVYGHPQMNDSYTFMPEKSVSENQICHGRNLVPFAHDFENQDTMINLDWLIDAYHQLSNTNDFFNSYFVKLAGTNKLQQQIESGLNAEQIRESWKDDLEKYKKIRAKYLLYPDF